MSDWNKLILGDNDSQTAPVCNGTVREMIADINRYREALEYYACAENYYLDFKNMAGMPTICVDNGNIARETLKEATNDTN